MQIVRGSGPHRVSRASETGSEAIAHSSLNQAKTVDLPRTPISKAIGDLNNARAALSAIYFLLAGSEIRYQDGEALESEDLRTSLLGVGRGLARTVDELTAVATLPEPVTKVDLGDELAAINRNIDELAQNDGYRLEEDAL